MTAEELLITFSLSLTASRLKHETFGNFFPAYAAVDVVVVVVVVIVVVDIVVVDVVVVVVVVVVAVGAVGNVLTFFRFPRTKCLVGVPLVDHNSSNFQLIDS